MLTILDFSSFDMTMLVLALACSIRCELATKLTSMTYCWHGLRCGLFAIAKLKNDTYECKLCKDRDPFVSYVALCSHPGQGQSLPDLLAVTTRKSRKQNESSRFA